MGVNSTLVEGNERATALVAFGSNLNGPEKNIMRAMYILAETSCVRIVETSSFYKTFPVGGLSDQPVFVNGMVKIETTLAPLALLKELQRIELELRRTRLVFWGPRTIDLDLILYGDVVMETRELTLPHPRLQWRDFVLEPACEIAAETVVPTFGLSFQQLRALLLWNFELYPFVCRRLGSDANFIEGSRKDAFEDRKSGR